MQKLSETQKLKKKMSYIARKFFILVLTLLFISIAVFGAFHIIPGDPAMLILGTEASEKSLTALREQLGTNRPLFEQYTSWLSNAIRGNFGLSLKYNKDIAELLKGRIAVTAILGITSLLFVFTLGIPLGIISGRSKNKFMQKITNLLSMLGISIPGFFLSLIVIWIFGFTLKCFTPGRYVNLSENPISFFTFMIFPAITIAIPQIAIVAKYLAASIKQEESCGYVRTARSKGCSENRILFSHILKNAIVSIVPLFGMIIGSIFSGSIIIEQVFGISGIGRLLISSVTSRDFPLAQTIVLYIAFIVVIVNFLVDIIVQLLDPRIRLEK